MKSCALLVLACMAVSACAAKPLRGVALETDIEKADARQMWILASIERKMAKSYEHEAVAEAEDAAAIREEAATKAMSHLDRVNMKVTDMGQKTTLEKEAEVTAGEAATDAAQIETVAEADRKDAAATGKDVARMENDAAALEKKAATAEKPQAVQAEDMPTVPKEVGTEKAADTTIVPKAVDTTTAGDSTILPKAVGAKAIADMTIAPKTLDAKVAPRVAVQFVKANAASGLRPIGEGAYQSHKAVMERTTSKDTHCEDAGLYKNEGKWNDCYHSDYVDAHKSYSKTQSEKSAAASAHIWIAIPGIGLLALVRALMVS